MSSLRVLITQILEHMFSGILRIWSLMGESTGALFNWFDQGIEEDGIWNNETGC